MEMEKHVGIVEGYDPEGRAASVRIEDGALKEGDAIHFRGPRTELEERIHRMELDHEPVSMARAGQQVGIEVPLPVEEGAEVLLVRDPYEEAEADLLGSLFGPSGR